MNNHAELTTQEKRSALYRYCSDQAKESCAKCVCRYRCICVYTMNETDVDDAFALLPEEYRTEQTSPAEENDTVNHPVLTKINDGGKRICYGENMAIREPSDGKGRFDLTTPFGEERIAKWYELGSHKYSDRNWEKGMPFSRYVNSAKRHINKYVKGMEDEDHLAAACWNLMAIMHHEELKQIEFDDMPHYLSKEKKMKDSDAT